VSLPNFDQAFVIGSLQTPIGRTPKISSELSWSDHWGAFKVRWGIGRMNYNVDPGLYALGYPDERSPVLVTANYKLSFDHLREALPERNLWVLVLDTKGINVWCAAGKGTFGTEELFRRVESSRVSEIVSHRELIGPQLAAPGVAAHKVKKVSGFKVIYGPIRSKDLPAFLDNGLKASPEMRLKTFSIWERAVLIPVELAGALKPGLVIMAIFFFLGGLGGPNGYWANTSIYGLYAVYALLVALLAGAVLTPLLLPWLPGRAFSVKGLIMGFIVSLILSAFRFNDVGAWQGRLEMAGWIFLIPTVAAYLSMNFTGASTYTSLSGVRKEMKWAVPLQVIGAVLGIGFWLTSRFLA
jgi:acetyl-CoA decarbonylase/synthase complex subunit gamma